MFQKNRSVSEIIRKYRRVNYNFRKNANAMLRGSLLHFKIETSINRFSQLPTFPSLHRDYLAKAMFMVNFINQIKGLRLFGITRELEIIIPSNKNKDSVIGILDCVRKTQDPNEFIIEDIKSHINDVDQKCQTSIYQLQLYGCMLQSLVTIAYNGSKRRARLKNICIPKLCDLDVVNLKSYRFTGHLTNRALFYKMLNEIRLTFPRRVKFKLQLIHCIQRQVLRYLCFHATQIPVTIQNVCFKERRF